VTRRIQKLQTERADFFVGIAYSHHAEIYITALYNSHLVSLR